MAGLAFSQERAVNARGTINQVADDTGVAIRIKYIGTGSVTSVIVTTATDVTAIVTEGTYAYTWAAYTTLGALVDKINADGVFQAKVLDALRSTATGSGLIIAGTLTTIGDKSYELKSDTSGANFMAARLTYDRTFGVGQALKNGHRVNLQEIVTNVTLGGGADSLALKIYECTPSSRGSVETLIYSKTPTSGSAATINWASGRGKITAGDGNDLVVILSDGTSVTGDITITGNLE